MCKAHIHASATALAALALIASVASASQNARQTAPDTQPSTRPTTPPLSLDVGSAAPPLKASAWLNGNAVRIHERGKPPVYVATFWASWSGPSRAALPNLVRLQEQFRERGVVFVGITDESAETVRAFLQDFKPAVTFPIALDDAGATARAYCEAAGVGFIPYAFVVGPDRTIAWHGHPQQSELVTIVEELLAGRYDVQHARELVRQARTVDQLEAVFREAYAKEQWQTALLALDGLLQTAAPQPRLLRYKLSILLGELDDVDQAQALAEELVRRYADNARGLNSFAWDVLSDPRLYLRSPEIGLKLARAAYRAGQGQDAAVADTYARALHLIGRVDLAIQVQARAVELSNAEQRAGYQRTLAFYRRCQALQADATAEPN